MSGLKIDLASLPQGVSPWGFEAEASALDLDPVLWPDRIEGRFSAEKNGDRIRLAGELSGTAQLDCVRCLKHFPLAVAVPFELFAERRGADSRDEDELERDAYMRFHDGRRLDLTADLRDALLLEVPMAPHCREDCRGLCPRCGADLNLGPCACGTAVVAGSP
jgi:uncharacterized protein